MWRLDDFELGPRIGSGTFGHVRIARERSSGTIAALKVMKKHRIEKQRVQRHVTREIEIQAHLRHPNVLQLFAVFWDATCLYMILEHARDGDLYEQLQKQLTRSFDEPTACRQVAQIADALEYCHRMHVIHRDVKPQNVFLGRGRRLKLADFGWAVHALPGQARKTLCGSPEYMAPEMVHATCGHGFEVDAWGLGVLAYELISGRTPFTAPEHKETYRRIVAASPDFSASAFPSGGVSECAIGFISGLLQREPAKRLPLKEATQHAWLAGNLKGRAARDGRAASAGA
jgi:serine/threonine protein kinase